ncbi:MAG: DUF1295 domain-containing protein [Chitinophagales bacterium]
MIRTAALLILTIIVLPLVAFKFGTPLDDTQWWMLKRSGMAMLGLAMGCFILSEITRNCSQFDKLWSILPIGYTWYFAHVSNYEPRLVLMAVLATIWGVRLTYNFARRGGYSWKFWSGEEDYRWEVLRQRPEFKDKKVAWTLFNFFFISIYQNALVWLFALPPVLAWQAHDKPLGIADYILAVVMIVLVITETIADQQQWNFQNKKYSKKKSGEALTKEEAQGFISSGLWAYSRHPNYACEQSIWVVFYLIGALATGMYINWSMAGCLLLILLFKGSSDFSEEISAGKYPAYKDYQARVGRFLPF